MWLQPSNETKERKFKLPGREMVMGDKYKQLFKTIFTVLLFIGIAVLGFVLRDINARHDFERFSKEAGIVKKPIDPLSVFKYFRHYKGLIQASNDSVNWVTIGKMDQ